MMYFLSIYGYDQNRNIASRYKIKAGSYQPRLFEESRRRETRLNERNSLIIRKNVKLKNLTLLS